jgi:uncharacterized protein YjlB
MTASMEQTKPLSLMFKDDGSIPNNPHIAMLLYRACIDLKGIADPERIFASTFMHNHWGEMWQNGIYPYAHYHSTTHEVMGIARGRAKVRFGGEHGQEIDLMASDVVILPAGTGHQCLWAGPDLVVIGAYPRNGRYDLCRGSKAEHAKAVAAIPRVPLPETDPVFGRNGPLTTLWRR